MKKFLSLIALISMCVPAIQSMEAEPELKNLKRSCEVIDSANDATDSLVTKKQKTEENRPVTSNGLAKKIVYGAPVAKQTTLNFAVGNKPQFAQVISAQVISKKSNTVPKCSVNAFTCSEPNCGKSFATKKSLSAHKANHSAMKRADRVFAAKTKEEALLMKIKNEQLK
jgi:hypothetical protein